jgi:hypothetical protein
VGSCAAEAAVGCRERRLHARGFAYYTLGYLPPALLRSEKRT